MPRQSLRWSKKRLSPGRFINKIKHGKQKQNQSNREEFHADDGAGPSSSVFLKGEAPEGVFERIEIKEELPVTLETEVLEPLLDDDFCIDSDKEDDDSISDGNVCVEDPLRNAPLDVHKELVAATKQIAAGQTLISDALSRLATTHEGLSSSLQKIAESQELLVKNFSVHLTQVSLALEKIANRQDNIFQLLSSGQHVPTVHNGL